MRRGKAGAEKQDQTQALGSAKIPSLILRFSATTLAALVLNSVYTLTDALFVSWGVGGHAMGGVSVVFPFTILQGAISTAVGGGAASIISRKLGAQKQEEAGEVTLNAMLVFYLSAVAITIAGFLLMDPLLSAMGVTGELYPYAREYFSILLAGNVFSTGFSSIIRAEGRMLYSLLIWVIPISINILLDAVFILALGWGVKGSALATVACQFVSFSMSVLFFLRFTAQRFRGARPSLKRAGEILAIGIPSLVQMGSLSITSALLNNALGSVSGALGVTAFGYITRLFTLGTAPFTAVAQALAPVAGYNHGAGQPRRVRETLRFSCIICALYAGAAFLLAEGVPGLLMRIFTQDAQLIAFGANAIRRTAAAFLFAPFPMLAGALFQAVGQKLRALLMYAANLLFLLPLSRVLPELFGVNGIWAAYVGANAAAAGLTLLLLLLDGCKRKKLGAAAPGIHD